MTDALKRCKTVHPLGQAELANELANGHLSVAVIFETSRHRFNYFTLQNNNSDSN